MKKLIHSILLMTFLLHAFIAANRKGGKLQ